MNDITELKQFVVAHAQAQNMTAELCGAVLDRIRSDDESAPGSWAVEWSAAGAERETAGDDMGAARCYNMARFPYVDGPARRDALEHCVAAFERWQDDKPSVERLEIDLPEGSFTCWAGGLSATSPRPLVIITGGIISIKEQWAPILPMANRLGVTIVVTEMPGVGENTIPYDIDGWRMFPAVLDAVKGRADTSRVYAAALSFSGHLALRWAAHDERLRGIVTIGAPISDFFTNRTWFQTLPAVTVDTLAHLTGAPAAKLPDLLTSWALDADLLSSLDIPVYYTASLRDEVIPPGDIEQLRRHVRKLDLTEYDDVHGSPSHADEIRLWVPLSLLKMSGTRAPQRMVLKLLLNAAKLRHRTPRAAA